jgi:hypothetical protein
MSGPLNDPDGIEVISGDCYWIEVTGDGDGNCQVLWTHSVDGNNFRLRDDNESFGPEDIREGDVVFCVDVGMRRGAEVGVDGGCGEVPAACCFRDETCQDAGFLECADWGGYPVVYGDCATPGICPLPPNDLCDGDADGLPDAHLEICAGEWIYYDGRTLGNRLGECENWPGKGGPGSIFYGAICHPNLQDCTDPPSDNVCFPHFNGAYECNVDVDNRLASTDGPIAGGDCFASGVYSFQADVWYTITAPCRGQAIITMCHAGAEFDSMLAVFSDHTNSPACPGSGDDNEQLLWCDDEYCSGSATVSGISWEAFEGASYILRLGGWSAAGTVEDASMGLSSMRIGFLCEYVPPYSPPELPPPPHDIKKHRYISINPNTNPSENSVIKVEVAEQRRCTGDPRRSCLQTSDCKDACDNNLDKTCTSDAQCGGGSCISIGTCVDIAPSNPPLAWMVKQPFQEHGACIPSCGETDWIAKLAAIADPPYSENWTGYLQGGELGTGLLHIGDCQIVPCVTYNVYACDPEDLSNCSEPLVVATQVMPWRGQRQYGDLAGPTDATLEITAPDGFTSVVDVFAWVLTKQNYGTAALPQAHVTRMDLCGPGIGIPPDYFLSVCDLQALYVFGFQRGLPWENSQGGLEPQNCP